MKTKNGISLIVLVLTVIVLAILAGAVIITLNNTNVIGEAKNAVDKDRQSKIEEAKVFMQADGMLGKTPEPIVIGDTTLIWDSDAKEVIEKTTENGTTTVGTVLIPEGFYYVGGTKTTGLVISDSSTDEGKGVDADLSGNQFVWVPVEYTATGTTDANGLDTGFTSVFKIGNYDAATGKMTADVVNDTYPIEPRLSYNTQKEVVSEYYNMMESVQKNNGFYIARYLAGDGEVTEARNEETEAHKVVIKKGAVTYNYVPFGLSAMCSEIGDESGAFSLSHSLYSENDAVTSTLLYYTQYVALLNWLAEDGFDLSISSRDWPTINKNVVDLSEDSYEFSWEFRIWLTEGCGGAGAPEGFYYPAVSNGAGYYPEDGSLGAASNGIGFRPALYINNI